MIYIERKSLQTQDGFGFFSISFFVQNKTKGFVVVDNNSIEEVCEISFLLFDDGVILQP